MENRLGHLLRYWRGARNVSQLQLAMLAAVSQRHLSFVESGRAKPSRDMIVKLAEALDLPLRVRNECLLAAGFAPYYPERSLTAAEMNVVQHALERMLAHHEPYPAMVLDASWNIVMSNAATERLIARCVSPETLVSLADNQKLNFIRLLCSPSGLASKVRSWPQTGPALIARLRREAASNPHSPAERLLRECIDSGAFPSFSQPSDAPLDAVVQFELEIDQMRLRLFNTVTSFGTPQDVTLQELRIENSFPLDETTDQILHKWANSRARSN